MLDIVTGGCSHEHYRWHPRYLFIYLFIYLFVCLFVAELHGFWDLISLTRG